MAGFDWKGRNTRGQLVEGNSEAEDRDRLATQLMNLGITPIDIHPARAESESVSGLGRLLGMGNPGTDDLILFTRQMYTLTKSGVPIIRGLKGVAASTRNPVLREAIDDLIGNLESGRELSAALARHPGIFPAMYASIIRIGETSGDLEGAFLQLTGYLEQDRDFRARVRTAMRYPLMVVAAIVIAVFILMIWVVPVFANLFQQHDAALPLATRIMIGASGFFVEYWWALLLGIAAAALAFRAWKSSGSGRLQWDRFRLRLPIIGPILYRATLARFARCFAMTYRSGVPLVQGLTLVARAVENQYIGQAVADMRTGIERGESLYRTAAATGLFSPLVLQMLAVGEETGDVDTMLAETAEYYEREVDYDLRNLSAYIEPVLLVLLAALVLLLALGVFLPMWDLGQAALG